MTGTNYLYHSLDPMTSEIAQDLDLSLDQVESQRAKLFSEPESQRSALLLLTGGKRPNVSILVDQSELCVGVISSAVQQELGLDEIVDLTLVHFTVMVLLLKKGRLVAFDCSSLFATTGPLSAAPSGGAWSSSQVRYLHTIELPAQHAWHRVEAVALREPCQVVAAASTKICIATLPLLPHDDEPAVQHLELPQDDG